MLVIGPDHAKASNKMVFFAARMPSQQLQSFVLYCTSTVTLNFCFRMAGFSRIALVYAGSPKVKFCLLCHSTKMSSPKFYFSLSVLHSNKT